jgi:probable HAF family extracellular repeat protein
LACERLEERLLPTYTVTDLGTLGGSESFGYAVDDYGHVAGTSQLACDCVLETFIWSGGTLHDLGVQGSALAINNRGQVAGEIDPVVHPFVWSRAYGVRDLGFVGVATGINDAGEVVGQTLGLYPQAFTWKDGTTTIIGKKYSGGYGVNNEGVVVGQAPVEGGHLQAVMWLPGGGRRDLGSLDGTSTSGAEAVNDHD